MSTFADFLLLRALPSYGGAEVLRARRTRDGQRVEAPVHLGLYSHDPRIERRIVAVAEASAQVAHEAVARIVEVGRYDGTLYAAAEAAEGVDLATLLEHEKRRRAVPDPSFVIGVVFSLARVVQDLHDRGDVWAQRATGLSGLFPAGLRPDAVVLRKDGAVLLRVLAGAADDAGQPTAYRAPELGAGRTSGRTSVAADVYGIVQLLRALLAVDANAHSSPRVPTRGGVLPTLLVGALQQNPDDRPNLDVVIDMLRDVFAANAPNQSPAAAIANALRREYRSLLLEDTAREDIAQEALFDLQANRAQVNASRQVLFPLARQASPVPSFDPEGGPTLATRRARSASDAVDRVFTEEGETNEASHSSDDGAFRSLPTPSARTVAPRSAPILDEAAATLAGDTLGDEPGERDKTHKLMRGAILDSGADLSDVDGNVPWISVRDISALDSPVFKDSDEGVVDEDVPAKGAQDDGEPAFAHRTEPGVATLAPPPLDSGMEEQDTVEMAAARETGGAPRSVSYPSNDSVTSTIVKDRNKA